MTGYKIKDLPEPDRPREKLKQHGASNLTDSELLALILGSGVEGKNAKELATEVINEHGIQSIQNQPIDRLCSINGISVAKASRLKASLELSQRMRREDREEINNLSHLVKMVEDMKNRDSEIMRVFALSSGNRKREEFEYEGSTDELSFSVSELLRDVVISGASGFILAHNHPSGSHEPSEADLLTTRRMIDAAEAVGVKFLDHVIVGDQVMSMRAATEVEFP